MPTTQVYDIAILGSGSAAFATAIEARRRNASVVMIEQGTVGGTCVNVGCIPSKALLAAAHVRHDALAHVFAGVDTSAGPVDVAALMKGKDEIVHGLRREKYVDLAGLYGFEIVAGVARFLDGPALDVDGRRIEASHYVIATGATPWAPPIPGLDHVDYLTSTTALSVEHIPSSLIVLGASAVGLELAQLFARLGARVTIVETLERIAPLEEPEVSDALAGSLTAEGLVMRTSAHVERVRHGGAGVIVELDATSGAEELEADAILVATGRRPATVSLGLEAVGVSTGPRGEIVVTEDLRTSNPRVFAVGDVTGHPQFVYVAGRHGTLAAANALSGGHERVDYRSLPRVTFTSPAVASVGLTEEGAERAGIESESRVLSFDHVPRAIVDRDTRGVVKIVAERATGRVLGVHMVADGASEAILAGVYAIDAGFTIDKLASAWTPYLTTSEAIKLAAQSFTLDVSSLSCCSS